MPFVKIFFESQWEFERKNFLKTNLQNLSLIFHFFYTGCDNRIALPSLYCYEVWGNSIVAPCTYRLCRLNVAVADVASGFALGEFQILR